MWRGGTSTQTERRWKHTGAQARAAWVLASDLAADALKGDMRKVVQGRGTVGRGADDLTSSCRKVACYLASVTANAAPERLAEASGLNRRTIHKHVAWVEDRREEPLFDAMIEGLERALVGMCARVVLANVAELDEADEA